MDFVLRMRRGDDRVATITAYYPDAIPSRNVLAGDALPLAGRDVVFVAYSNADDPEGSVVFLKRTGVGNGIVVRAAPEDNVAEVQIARADTVPLTSDATLYCEAKVETGEAGNDEWTIADGSLFVEHGWVESEAGG